MEIALSNYDLKVKALRDSVFERLRARTKKRVPEVKPEFAGATMLTLDELEMSVEEGGVKVSEWMKRAGISPKEFMRSVEASKAEVGRFAGKVWSEIDPFERVYYLGGERVAFPPQADFSDRKLFRAFLELLLKSKKLYWVSQPPLTGKQLHAQHLRYLDAIVERHDKDYLEALAYAVRHEMDYRDAWEIYEAGVVDMGLSHSFDATANKLQETLLNRKSFNFQKPRASIAGLIDYEATEEISEDLRIDADGKSKRRMYSPKRPKKPKATGAAQDAAACKRLYTRLGLASAQDFRKWILRNHPDRVTSTLKQQGADEATIQREVRATTEQFSKVNNCKSVVKPT